MRANRQPAMEEGTARQGAWAGGAREIALKRDPYFDFGGALLQIAVVLASASLILGGSLLRWISGVLGVFGALLTLNGFLLLVEIPFLGCLNASDREAEAGTRINAMRK